jgi:predicted enzyme related to lactoylglutathione lyase
MPRIPALAPGQPIWFDLMTSDLADAQRFYAGVLGWTYDHPGEFAHVTARRDGAAAAGLGSTPPGADLPPSWSVYFGVTDADAALAGIVAGGGSVIAPVMAIGDTGRMAMASDPTGAVFGVWEPGTHRGAELVGEPGAMAWCEVNTRDAAGAAAFYTTQFGLRNEASEVQGTAYHLLWHGERRTCGVLQMNADWGDMPPHWMAYFAVADADKAKLAVEAFGGTVPYGPFDTPRGRMIVAMDPQGAPVSFIAMEKGS